MDINIIKLLNKILGLYTHYDLRQEEKEADPNESVLNFIANKALYFANLVTGEEQVQSTLRGICAKVKNDINKPQQTTKEWLDLCISLGTNAEIARNLPTFARRSRCHEILHCIRNAILTAIRNDANDQATYDARIAELNTILAQKKGERSRLSNQSLPSQTDTQEIKKLNEEIKTLVVKLAYLEDYTMINIAMTSKFLDLVKCEERHKALGLPEPITYPFNDLAPYVLQRGLLAIHYGMHYQVLTNQPFHVFCREGCELSTNNNSTQSIQVFINAYPEKAPSIVSNLINSGFYKPVVNERTPNNIDKSQVTEEEQKHEKNLT